ncbi:MAG: histidine phosphatase family protein [Chloroflexota bacterium]
MSEFLLVRHSISKVDVSVPAATWGLTAEGQDKCVGLAAEMAPHQPTAVFTSHEPKAVQTGQIVGEILGIPVETAVNLHEHDRSNVTNMSQQTFKSNVTRLFTDPDTHFFGTESGAQARHRFAQAVKAVLQASPEDKVAIVAHGTVITLFLAAHNPIDPIPFWQALKMPDLLVAKRETYQLVKREA